MKNMSGSTTWSEKSTFQSHEDLEASIAIMAILEDFIEDDIISFEICHSNEIVCYDCEGYENNFSFFLFLLSFLFLCKISL